LPLLHGALERVVELISGDRVRHPYPRRTRLSSAGADAHARGWHEGGQLTDHQGVR
jgi:hypothetical protein